VPNKTDYKVFCPRWSGSVPLSGKRAQVYIVWVTVIFVSEQYSRQHMDTVQKDPLGLL